MRTRRLISQRQTRTRLSRTTTSPRSLRPFSKASAARENVASLDNCITRLRIEVKDGTQVNEKKIKAAGVAGVMRPSQTAIQVIIGTKVQFVADEMAKML